MVKNVIDVDAGGRQHVDARQIAGGLGEGFLYRSTARTFFGSSMAWLRGFGPNALPPPRNSGALRLP